MPVCDVCGKVVSNLRKHKERGRCGKKGTKKGNRPPKYRVGSPEFRLGLDL
ncbi:MAG: hypothetical protein ABSG92_06310 [Conexivisphaerales archaeon]|jgi:hypothetical protein